MRFNPAIEGRVAGTWYLARSPYGIEQIVDPTTWGLLAGLRPEFPNIPIRGLPANISAGLNAMVSVLGPDNQSFFTLAEIKAYGALVVSEGLVERSIAPGDIVRERAPMLASLVAQMMQLGQSFGVPDTNIRLVYGFD